MKFEKIMTVLAIGLTTIVSVGCMEKESIAVEAPTTETSGIVTTIETTTSTIETTTTSTLETATTTTSESTISEVATTTAELSNNTAVSETNTNCACGAGCSCAGTMNSKETTTTTIDETKPEPTESVTTEKVEEIVDALVTDVSDFFDSVETQIETEIEKEARQREFVVYKPSTHYIHRSTCHWVDSTCYEIENTDGLEVRKCTECNPNIEIVTPFVIETKQKEVASSMSADYLGNFQITGYYGDGQTASGKTPRINHTIAMNSSQRKELGLSYGDVIYIDGDIIKGYYTLEDCGCKWGVIDVFCSNAEECYQITSYADAYSKVIINEN